MGHMNVLAAKAAHHYMHEPTCSCEALRAGIVDSEGLFKCLCLALYEGALILVHEGELALLHFILWMGSGRRLDERRVADVRPVCRTSP